MSPRIESSGFDQNFGDPAETDGREWACSSNEGLLPDRRLDRLPFQLRRVPPEIFQAIELSLFVVKDVNHDL